MNFIDSLFGHKNEHPTEDGNLTLVRVMHEVASNDNPANRKNLYTALLGSMLLVPIPEIPVGLSPGLSTTQGEVQLRLTSVLDRNGIKITAAFTDVEALRTWDPNTPYIGLKAQDLFRAVMGTDIQELAINPFDPIRKMIRPGGRVRRHEMELLSSGVVPGHPRPAIAQFQLKSNDKVFIGRPAIPLSAEVEKLLQGQAACFPSIEGLHVFQMANQSGSSRTVIGITLSAEVSNAKQEEIVWAMGESVRPELESGQSLDFMFLLGGLRDQVTTLCSRIFHRQ